MTGDTLDDVIRRWKQTYIGKSWCVVQINKSQPYLVIPTLEVMKAEHVVIQDLTREDAQMWKKIMS